MINAYDEVPYSAAAHAQTHPENLRLIAVLLGLDPIAARIARVLEIGCANGTNLFPMAEAYPDAHFVGLDYSQKQIDQAENYKQALGINNIEFHALDVVAIPKAISSNLGQFDYIICHGVFSWVEESVRLAILHMIRNHLSSNGVAFLSYNCYPGWKVREIARDMMLYHGNQFTEPGQRYKQARAMAEFVHENHNGENDVYGKLLEDSLHFASWPKKDGTSKSKRYQAGSISTVLPVFRDSSAAIAVRAAVKPTIWLLSGTPPLAMQSVKA